MVDFDAYDSLLKLVKKRRSVRYFKTDPIPDEYIDKIIEVARWAPSGFHTQPWEFIVVKKKEVKDKIADAINPVSRQGGLRDAPVFIILLGDWRAKVGLPDLVQKNDKSAYEVLFSSLANTFLYMHLAAASLGLASQWCTAVGRGKTESAIKDIIGIPESLKIYDMMVLGFADHLPIPKEVMRNWADMVHYDDCGAGDFRTGEEVVADAEKSRSWCVKAH